MNLTAVAGPHACRCILARKRMTSSSISACAYILLTKSSLPLPPHPGEEADDVVVHLGVRVHPAHEVLRPPGALRLSSEQIHGIGVASERPPVRLHRSRLRERAHDSR